MYEHTYRIVEAELVDDCIFQEKEQVEDNFAEPDHAYRYIDHMFIDVCNLEEEASDDPESGLGRLEGIFIKYFADRSIKLFMALDAEGQYRFLSVEEVEWKMI